MHTLIPEDDNDMEAIYSPVHLETMEKRCVAMRHRGWHYYVLLKNYKDFYFACDWCKIHLKIGETVTWHGMQFWFKNEQDQMLFTLTWQ